MTPVVVERRHGAPVLLADVAATRGEVPGLGSVEGAGAVLHAVSADGLRSVSVYETADAEVLRRPSGRAGPGFSLSMWPATEHWWPPASPRPALVTGKGQPSAALIDRHFEAPTDYWSQVTGEEDDYCLRIHNVGLLRSYLSLDRRRMFCIYRAPDVESVRAASRLGCLPVTEVMTALLPQKA